MAGLRFKPGVSGNPRGRPKGARSVAQQFMVELSKLAEGDPERLSKLDAAIKALVDKAVGGDQRAVQAVLERVEQMEARLSAAAQRALVFSEADREAIAEIHRRLTLSSPVAGEVSSGAQRSETEGGVA